MQKIAPRQTNIPLYVVVSTNDTFSVSDTISVSLFSIHYFIINDSLMYLQSAGPWWKAKVGSKTGLIPSNYGKFSCYFYKVFFAYQAHMQHHESLMTNITNITVH